MSTASLTEVEEVFETALTSKENIRIECGSHGGAMNLRQRLNNWRAKNRKENQQIYPVDHPLYGASVYDTISMRVPPEGAPDSHYIYISKRESLKFKIEKVPGQDPVIEGILPEGDDTK